MHDPMDALTDNINKAFSGLYETNSANRTRMSYAITALDDACIEIEDLIREGIANDEIRKLQRKVDTLTERLNQGIKDNELLYGRESRVAA